MPKCICCKFDNCKREFEKHRSNTSFSALSTQFDTVAVLLRQPQDYVDKVCSSHTDTIYTWIHGVFTYYDSLKGGVKLVKITRD